MVTTKSATNNVLVCCLLMNKDTDDTSKKYRSLIGRLMYLQSISRPDLTMVTCQCTRFNNDPKLSYEGAVKQIVRYLLDTREKTKSKPNLCQEL